MNDYQALMAMANADYDEGLVTVNHQAISKLKLQPGNDPDWSWLLNSSLKTDDMRPAIMFWILAIAQAFRFWAIDGNQQIIKYRVHGESGSAAMFTALMALWGDYMTPKMLRKAEITVQWVKLTMGNPPAAIERAAILNELLEGDELEAAADYLIGQAQRGLLGINQCVELSRRFPIAYGGDLYYKKAQLLCSVVISLMRQRGVAVRDQLTAMADYQVPRVLRALDVLVYSDDLADMVDQAKYIDANSTHEKAIRGATLLGCEAISKHYQLPQSVVDNIIWSSQHLAGDSRFHLTITTNY